MPTVSTLVGHVACETAEALYNHTQFQGFSLETPAELKLETQIAENKVPDTTDEANLWGQLVADNFVAGINLQLSVTNNEGFNPSLTFLTPLTPYPIPSLASSGGSYALNQSQTAFTGNFSLGINGQFDLSQYRSVSLSYLVDLSELFRLLERYEAPEVDRILIEAQKRDAQKQAADKNAAATSITYIPGVSMDKSKAPANAPVFHPGESTPDFVRALRESSAPVKGWIRPLTFDCGLTAGLSGNLGIEGILATGLRALEDTKYYNVYGSSPSSTEALDYVAPDRILPLRQGPGVGVAASAPASPPTQPPTTRFSEMISPDAVQGLRRPPSNPTPTPTPPSTPAKPPRTAAPPRTTQDMLANLSAQLATIADRLANIDASTRTVAGGGRITGTIPAAEPGGGGGSTAAGPPVTFGSTVQFTVNEGLNGGPNWTLRHFTGPGGGSGGSGGSGGGGGMKSGSSGGASSSGSASQGLLNINRSVVDYIQITAGATCNNVDKKLRVPIPETYWDSIPNCKDPAAAAAKNSLNLYLQLHQLSAN